MELKQLMIGNYYKWYADGKDYYYKVEAKDFANDNYKNFQPIELTPDIMQKIKGIKQKEGGLGLYYYIEPYSVLRFFFDGTQLVIIKKEKGNIWIANKKYLHEFQNLYFALTGEELEMQL